MSASPPLKRQRSSGSVSSTKSSGSAGGGAKKKKQRKILPITRELDTRSEEERAKDRELAEEMFAASAIHKEEEIGNLQGKV